MSNLDKSFISDAPWRSRLAGTKRFVGGMVVLVGLALMAALLARSRFQTFGVTRKGLIVFSSYSDSLVARKQTRLLNGIHHVVLRPHEQRRFVADYCYESLSRYEELNQDFHSQHLATELWKYCALSSGLGKTSVYLDLDSPILIEGSKLTTTLRQPINMATLSSAYEPNTVHASFLILQRTQQSTIAVPMLQLLTQTPIKRLLQKPLLLPKLLYALLAQSLQFKQLQPGKHKQWILLQQYCHMSAHRVVYEDDDAKGWLDSDSVRNKHACPLVGDFCCSVHDTIHHRLFLMNQHPIHPLPVGSKDALPLPLNARQEDWQHHADLPFITTLQVRGETRRAKRTGLPERFDDLLRNNCLPSDACNSCLAEYDGCSDCADECGCYCKTLCKEKSVVPDVALSLMARPPQYHRDANRLIPRIIHQTWYENITAEEYPDASRLMQSFRRSGWEHRFYTNDDMVAFLKTHFPPPVLQAYHSLVPSHLKSHLFRYCVVFVYGGLYADIDVLLESTLDRAIEADVGFLAPMDEPSEVDCCLSKSFFAAAPGHPFLARAIETLVNQVRNRFSLVDMDHAFCPRPDLFSIRSDKATFVTGSCLLGTSVNSVMKRPRLFPFEVGEVEHSHVQLPGRTIILRRNGQDMGGTRYTEVDRNLIVAVADVDVSEEGEERAKFTRRTKDFGGRFEFEGLYRDLLRAHENIQIRVEHH